MSFVTFGPPGDNYIVRGVVNAAKPVVPAPKPIQSEPLPKPIQSEPPPAQATQAAPVTYDATVAQNAPTTNQKRIDGLVEVALDGERVEERKLREIADAAGRLADAERAKFDAARRQKEDDAAHHAALKDERARAKLEKEEARRALKLRRETEDIEACEHEQRQFLTENVSLDAVENRTAFNPRRLAFWNRHLMRCLKDGKIKHEADVCAAPPDAFWTEVCQDSPAAHRTLARLDAQGNPMYRVGVCESFLGKLVFAVEIAGKDDLLLLEVEYGDKRAPQLVSYMSVFKPEADGMALMSAAISSFRDLHAERGAEANSRDAYAIGALMRALRAAASPYPQGSVSRLASMRADISRASRALTLPRVAYYVDEKVFAKDDGTATTFYAAASSKMRRVQGLRMGDVRAYARAKNLRLVELCTPELKAAGLPPSSYAALFEAEEDRSKTYSEDKEERPEEIFKHATRVSQFVNMFRSAKV